MKLNPASPAFVWLTTMGFLNKWECVCVSDFVLLGGRREAVPRSSLQFASCIYCSAMAIICCGISTVTCGLEYLLNTK